MSGRPPRIPGFDYRGFYAYFFTASTWRRQPAFATHDFASAAVRQLLQRASREGFAVPAYCLMPDHVHVLIEAHAAGADGLRFFNYWRQWAGFNWKRTHGDRLWQEGYWDYVLRDDDGLLEVAAYIVNNPVRAGLAQSVADYPYAGSSVYSMQELAEAAMFRRGRD